LLAGNAASGGFEPVLPIFYNAANGFYHERRKTFNNCFGFEQGLWWRKTKQLRHTP